MDVSYVSFFKKWTKYFCYYCCSCFNYCYCSKLFIDEMKRYALLMTMMLKMLKCGKSWGIKDNSIIETNWMTDDNTPKTKLKQKWNNVTEPKQNHSQIQRPCKGYRLRTECPPHSRRLKENCIYREILTYKHIYFKSIHTYII